jgi:predicted nucleic acid-binding protein
MESAVLGLVLDSSVLVAAERQKLTTPQVIRKVRETAGDVTIVICPMTIAELAHGRTANRPESFARRTANCARTARFAARGNSAKHAKPAPISVELYD